MLYLAVLLLLSAAGIWIFCQRQSLLYPSDYPKVIVLGSDKKVPIEQIPRIIWAYWHDDTPPLLVQRCIANWRALNPDYELRLLHPLNIAEHLDPDEFLSNYASLAEFRKADWLRLAVLRRYGGIWLDASLFLTRSLAWVTELQQTHGTDYVGFYNGEFTLDGKAPVPENWFMAAVPGSIFITDLCKEFEIALLAGEKAYLDALRTQGLYWQAVQNINMHEYLIMHVVASKLLAEDNSHRLCLLKAEESALFYLYALGRRNTRMYLNLALLKTRDRLPAVIKLRGGERNFFQRRLRLGLYFKHSIIGHFLLTK